MTADAQDDVLAALYAQAGARLGAFGYLLTGSYSASEELMQAAIVKTFVSRRRLRDVPSAEAYVRAAMRTLHIDRMRREQRWRRIMPGQAAAEQQSDNQSSHAVHDEVARAIATLPPRVRVAVALHYFEDLSVASVADHMRVSQGTVKGYLKDGRARLAPLLGVVEQDSDVMDVKGARR